MSEATTMSSDDLAALKIDRSRKRRRVSPWMWVVLVAVVAVAVLSPRLLRGLQVVEVSVATAVNLSAATGKPVDGSPELTAAGYVVADRQSVLAAKFTGRLAKLNVAEADFVKKGDVVAEIDHSELDATIVQAEAEVAEAAAEVQRLTQACRPSRSRACCGKSAAANARRREQAVRDSLGRRPAASGTRRESRAAPRRHDSARWTTAARKCPARKPRSPGRSSASTRRNSRLSSSESQAAVARAAVGSAEARQRTAAARVKVLESQRDESFIRSPFDGMVTEKAAEVGEIVAPISIGGSMARGSIVTIADWASLQAEVDVAEAQLGRVKAGQRAAITVDAIPGRSFPASCAAFCPARIAARRPSKSASISSRATRRRFSRRWACASDSSRTTRRPASKPALSGTGSSCPQAAVQSGRGRQFRVGRQRRRGAQASRPGRGEFRRADRDHQRRQPGRQGRGPRRGEADRRHRQGAARGVTQA